MLGTSQIAPVAKIYTLADVLAACINSSGGTAGDGSPCGQLFSYTSVGSAAPPTDTIAASIALAQHPSLNVAKIYDLLPPTAPFQPYLIAAPNDWTLPITPAPPAPTISPASGSYANGQAVTIADSTPGAPIYYTLDGSVPSASNTLYTGPLTLTHAMTLNAIAMSDGLSSALASATYTLPVTVTLTPGSAALVASETQAFSATVAGSSNTAVTWSLSPAVGSISVAGFYTAPATIAAAQTVTVKATSVADSTKVASATITLAASASVEVVPNNIGLTSSQGESFAATVSNGSSSAVTWSINPQVGTISQSGYYGAPGMITNDQTVTVTATSVSNPAVSASATVLLNAPTATSSTAVQPLGFIPSTQVLNGLGFNIDPTTWEFQLAAAAGATHIRFQCGWISNESQTSPPFNQNTSTRYLLQPACLTALALSKQYGMHPTIIAGYGPPYHAILNVLMPGGAAAGATTINIQFASGVGGDTFQALAPFYDTIINSNNSQITTRNSYAGALVTAVKLTDATHATLTLASALTAALPASIAVQYTISEYLYPPAATSSPTDPSVLDFTNYEEFLAQSISSAGLTGEVEIWNEPVWGPDPWDDRVNFYDTFTGANNPGPQTQGIPNYGLAAALQNLPNPVPGVTYIWAGTEKSGDNSVVGPAMLANAGVLFDQPATVVTSESFHPYGNNPEDSIWNESCLQSTINPYPASPAYFSVCNVNSASAGNYLKAEQQSLVEKSRNPAWGIAHNITETGFGLAGGDTLHQARFITRQFLGFQAAGVTPIEFYRLYDTSSDELSFTNPTTEAPLPAYSAIAGLMSDVATIGNAPITPSTSSNLCSVVGYSGTYVLDTVHLVGSRSGDSSNSEIFALWQQSETPNTGTWANLAQPAAAPVTIAIPSGSVVSKVINADTRQAVTYKTSGQDVTFSVSDDPIEVIVVPN